MTIVSIDSSGAGSAKSRFLDMNALRSAQVGGGSSAQDKKSDGLAESEQKPSFENLLKSLINAHLAVDKEKEVIKADEAVSQVATKRPHLGINDGFNRGGAEASDWGPGRNA